MDANFNIQLYRERWKAVEEIERQELRAISLEDQWRQINSLFQFALGLGLSRGDNDGEMDMFFLWAKLKGLGKYEGCRPSSKGFGSYPNDFGQQSKIGYAPHRKVGQAVCGGFGNVSLRDDIESILK
jgi:hypothetical protein